MLSYQTEHLTRDDIVDATYEAARDMNRLKYDHALLEEETYRDILEKLEISERVVDRVDEIYASTPEGERDTQLEKLAEEVPDFGEYSIAGEDELWWQNDGLASLPTLARLGVGLASGELKQRVQRMKWALGS